LVVYHFEVSMVIYSDDNLIFEVDERYYKVTVCKRTWYWFKATGKFDGTSVEVSD
jgi:hypothetical protein